VFRDLQIATLDFETYFAKDYSLRLKKYNTSEYIRDPQFKAQCVAIKLGSDPVVWYRDHHIDSALRSIDWSKTALLAHNTAFDGLILSYHYGIYPKYYLDTLSMARAIHSNRIRAGLDVVCSFYGVGNKQKNVLDQTKGVRELSDELMQLLGVYCAVDTELCRAIFNKMRGGIPEEEFDLIDLTLRMFCDPMAEVDLQLAQEALDEEIEERRQAIAAACVDESNVAKALLAEAAAKRKKITDLPKAVLGSSEAFAAFLRERAPDLEIPTKQSVKQKKVVYAFSKQDLAFMALRGHPNEAVRHAVEARLAVKSTIGETRAERFLAAGRNGKLPILLNYCGAHTTRWTGGNSMNLQNLVRGGKLRRSILAPEGHVIVSCDSSQIEARTLAWLADNYKMIADFRAWDNDEGPDVYKLMASSIYNKKIEDITKDERFIGKVVVLGAGFGMGGEKYHYTLAAGLMGPPKIVPVNECVKIITAFREKNADYPKLWKTMDHFLACMMNGSSPSHKCLQVVKKRYEILLPNGLKLHYPNLHAHNNDHTGGYQNYTYTPFGAKKEKIAAEELTEESPTDEDGTNKLYGGLLTENVVQALARIIVADQMRAIAKELRVISMTHDEVIAIAKESEAEEAKQFMLTCMRKTPSWCEDLPLNAEAEYGLCYS
jgi:DNA polymerase family A